MNNSYILQTLEIINLCTLHFIFCCLFDEEKQIIHYESL